MTSIVESILLQKRATFYVEGICNSAIEHDFRRLCSKLTIPEKLHFTVYELERDSRQMGSYQRENRISKLAAFIG